MKLIICLSISVTMVIMASGCFHVKNAYQLETDSKIQKLENRVDQLEKKVDDLQRVKKVPLQ